MPNRFTLYGHWMSGPTYKVGLMLSLCGQPFDYVHVNLLEGEHKKPPYLEKNRYGQVPCLLDGGQNLCQSASILQYLAETLSKFDGSTALQRARVREWLYWDFEKLAPAFYRSRGARAGVVKLDQAVISLYQEEGQRALKTLNRELDKSEWLTGSEPTIADIDVYGVVHFASDGGFDVAACPNVVAWISRFKGLSGYGEPHAILPHESRAA